MVEQLSASFGMENAGMRDYIDSVYRWFDMTFDSLLSEHNIDEDEAFAWMQQVLLSGVTDQYGDTHDVSSLIPWLEVWADKRFEDEEEEV